MREEGRGKERAASERLEPKWRQLLSPLGPPPAQLTLPPFQSHSRSSAVLRCSALHYTTARRVREMLPHPPDPELHALFIDAAMKGPASEPLAEHEACGEA